MALVLIKKHLFTRCEVFIFERRERVKAQKKHMRVPRSNKCLSGFRKVEKNKGDKIRCCGENEELGELL